ncbi:bifunctional diguanylate cyclase/phosphodiesterase [Dactylosporangium sp. NBC_01737]|uniref:putative bifunctional diguanylate cyclase/phosphodiesterase n=1 Tax=Dactylosporangium sp. NBC_01737 TaxID=2975959 RepID=UPI002E11EA4A|nr:bifunctional diguanylate cyclase/phosphodiesterase [Dactylosporangium sp. NBC_01737]
MRRKPSPHPRPAPMAGRPSTLLAVAGVFLIAFSAAVPAMLRQALSGFAMLVALGAAGAAVLLVRQRSDRLRRSLARSSARSKGLERELRQRATRDPVTGLANRRQLTERLDQVLTGVTPGVTVALLDLDGFKDVNDTFGHAAGDELLVQVSRRLRAALPDADVLARLGDDEFAVVWRGADHAFEDTLAQLRPSYPVAGRQVHLTGSAGIVAVGDQRSSADVLRDADLALDAAKHAGKDRVVRFDPDLRAAAARHRDLATGLRRALADGEFTLHYQPVVRLADGRVTAVEALLRWPAGGVPPLTFIPVAEATGLIVPLGWWVLRQACTDARAWFERDGVAVTVNVSGHQLREQDFVERVLAVLDETGLPPAALVLELTESVLVDDAERTARLGRLRERGVRIAVDDFGTGYSSLAYLVHLPVDILKIDRTFTASGVDSTLMRVILQLAEGLSLHTVAEGVETAGQAAALRALGCQYAQGYLYSRPLPADELFDALPAR